MARSATAPISVVMALKLALLAACSTLPPTDTEQREREFRYEQRFGELENHPSWSLEGRLAVSDNTDGGSGHFNWRQDDKGSRMDFHGALGRGAWNLVADSSGAVLELADGSRHQAVTVDILARQQLGWQIPVDTLAWWVRGLAAPEAVEQRQLDENGNLIELKQRGWIIEYGKYRVTGGVLMPVKMTARKADKSVKLAIRTWTLPGGHEGNG